MTTTPSEAVAALQQMARTSALGSLCEEHGLALLVAFGSAIDPERASEAADLDLAVAFTASATGDVLRLSLAIERALDLPDIDVMDLDRASAVARYKALATGLPLFESEHGIWATTQMAAMLEYMDTAWLRELDHRLMTGAE